jgi:hypothetical protein
MRKIISIINIFKTNLPSALITSTPLLPFFSNSFAFVFLKRFWNSQNLAKMKYICKKSSNQGMSAISLLSCSHYNANFSLTNQCSLFTTVRNIFEINEEDRPPNTPTPLVTHARDHWWTSDFANAFVFLGVITRAELVPSPRANDRNGAERRSHGGDVYCCIYSVREIYRKSAFADVKNMCS